MLTKNFRPRSFSICPLDVSDDSITTSTSTTKKATKELMIARFGLTSRITIDLVNLHLHSDLSRSSDEKRCRALENLFKQMNTNNYMLIGDFNFGDYNEKEQNMLEKYSNDVHDLWKEIYNLDEVRNSHSISDYPQMRGSAFVFQNPGFTFDPSSNICAHITSVSQIKRRLDRYFIHTLQNLSYSVEHINMIGTDTIPIDRLNNDDDKRINLSDHYALQLIIQFRTRSISHRSALVLLPTTNQWPLIECYREQYDPSFNRWPPHINLLWPFFDLNDNQDDEESILLPLRLLLSQYQSFDAEINGIDRFVENNICFMKLNEQSTERAKQLYEQMKQLFPQCCTNNRNSYNPHMTIAQFDSEEKRNQAQLSLSK
jgi:2'-5' RNA ligase